MAPSLSIVVPTYNRSADLFRCLSSILAADFEQKFEIIVSDNNSEDETQHIIRKFQNLHDGIRLITQSKNVGPELNMLAVLSEASSEWVLTLTDDDWLLPCVWGVLRQCLNVESDVRFILSPLHQIGPDGNPINDYLKFAQASKDGQILLAREADVALPHFFWHGHIFSRWLMRRDSIDLQAFKSEIGKHLYSPMAITTTLLRDYGVVYINRAVVCHRVGNPIFWEYPPDFMYEGIISMIKNLVPAGSTQRSLIKSSATRAISQIEFVASKTSDFGKSYVASLERLPDFCEMPEFIEQLHRRYVQVNDKLKMGKNRLI